MVEDTVTPAFFYHYDGLSEDAARIKGTELASKKAEIALSGIKSELQSIQRQIVANRSNYQEQTQRIQLVSESWFFGTTALQPQLWLRGGCQGKIKRAQAKLEKCESEYPSLLARQIQVEEQLPEAIKKVEDTTRVYRICVDAKSKRRQMFENLVKQHPSPKLFELQEQSLSLSSRLDQVQNVLGQTKRSQACHDDARSKLNHAYHCMNKAKRFQDQCTRHERDIHSHRRSNRSRNYIGGASPCPGGCGYAKSSWHPTHCCNACRHKNKGYDHGKRCERKQHDDLEARREQQETQRIERQLDEARQKANSQLQQSRDAFEIAVDQIRQARTIIQILESQRGTNSSENGEGLSGSNLFGTSFEGVSSLALGLDRAHKEVVTANNLGQAIEHVRLREQECIRLQDCIGQLERDAKNELASLRQLKEQTEEETETEKMHIFDDLRMQTMTSVDCVAPSAPPADF